MYGKEREMFTKIPRYYVAESRSEDIRDDSGWKEKEESGV